MSRGLAGVHSIALLLCIRQLPTRYLQPRKTGTTAGVTRLALRDTAMPPGVGARGWPMTKHQFRTPTVLHAFLTRAARGLRWVANIAWTRRTWKISDLHTSSTNRQASTVRRRRAR